MIVSWGVEWGGNLICTVRSKLNKFEHVWVGGSWWGLGRDPREGGSALYGGSGQGWGPIRGPP